MEGKNWKEFAGADEHSFFFCKVSDVQRRLLVRWAGVAKNKGESCTESAKKSVFEKAGKRLGIMENAFASIGLGFTAAGAWTRRSSITFRIGTWS